ncbi:craniofacial development protein 2-like [Palaemon carinicauda]|uniref:craniofacial development protein 2-like n=1 Tax=Palaemon carinicauda TaxID=392227 RepID=UPI0035B66FFA
MMTPRADKSLTDWRAVKSSVLLAQLKSKQCNVSIIVCYAPTNYSLEGRKEEYYEELQSIIDEIPERDMKIVISDFNAKVKGNNQGMEKVMGVEGLGEVANENGAHFVSFCSTDNLVIRSTLFQHKDIQKYALTSPCANYKIHIDHIAIDKERMGTLRSVRSYRGADIGIDHQLTIAKLILNLNAPNTNLDGIPRFDTTKLLEDEHRQIFAVELAKVYTSLKLRAVDTIEKPSIVISDILTNVSQVTLASLPDTSAMRKTIKHKRKSVRAPPPTPADLQELELLHQYKIYIPEEWRE